MTIFNNIGRWEILLVINVLILQFVYYLPTLVAIIKKRPYTLRIFLFNMILGWTIIGWIFALVWSLKHQ
jgi:hypothetical protein